MKNTFRHLILCALISLNCSCSLHSKPVVSPNIETPPATDENRQNIIGEVEPIYLPPIKTPFPARVDTGAATSSIDATNIRYFERDGEKWVAFTLTNRLNKETHRFEKKIHRQTFIKRIDEDEKRTIVEMDVSFGSEKFTALFTLADRRKFEYQALIGRNILTGRAIVDTSLSNTLH